MNEDSNPVEGTDAIARLVRLAGTSSETCTESAERVRGEVERAWRETVRHRRRSRVRLLAGGSLAAAAGLALVLGLSRPEPVLPPDPVLPPVRAGVVERVLGLPQMTGESGRHPLYEGMEVVYGETLVTSSTSRIALRLGTGHSIRLDHDSRLRLGDTDTLVLESGAVYVDSESTGISLEIVTSRGRVEEVGTQFEVRALEDSLRVRVREGAILLLREDEEDRANAGSELFVTEDGTLHTAAVSAHDPDWLWTQEIAPAYALEGRSLGEFLIWVARETGRDVRFERSALEAEMREVELHGDLEAMNPEEALAAVLPTCGLRFRARDDRYLIEEIL